MGCFFCYDSIPDKYTSFQEVQSELRKKGLESCNLIIGIDVTGSNHIQPINNNVNVFKSFPHSSLHYIPQRYTLNDYSPGVEEGGQYDINSSLFSPSAPLEAPHTPKTLESKTNIFQPSEFNKSLNVTNTTFRMNDVNVNPYCKVIQYIGKSLEAFDDDKKIPAYYFGDFVTRNQSVRSFVVDKKTGKDISCNGFNDVLENYFKVIPTLSFSGPTSFAPLIYKAIDIVQNTNNGYHILIIVTDGMVANKNIESKAICEASNYPLSIVIIGVGDGPFDTMEDFDDKVLGRKFDNVQFVNFTKLNKKLENMTHPEYEFALQCLMEVPTQYKKIKQLGYL